MRGRFWQEAATRVCDEAQDCSDHRAVNMSRLVVLGRPRLTCARDKLVIEGRKRIDPHLRVALEAVLPMTNILVDYLVVARAAQNQDRHVETARDCDFIARVEVI